MRLLARSHVSRRNSVRCGVKCVPRRPDNTRRRKRLTFVVEAVALSVDGRSSIPGRAERTTSELVMLTVYVEAVF